MRTSRAPRVALASGSTPTSPPLVPPEGCRLGQLLQVACSRRPRRSRRAPRGLPSLRWCRPAPACRRRRLLRRTLRQAEVRSPGLPPTRRAAPSCRCSGGRSLQLARPQRLPKRAPPLPGRTNRSSSALRSCSTSRRARSCLPCHRLCPGGRSLSTARPRSAGRSARLCRWRSSCGPQRPRPSRRTYTRAAGIRATSPRAPAAEPRLLRPLAAPAGALTATTSSRRPTRRPCLAWGRRLGPLRCLLGVRRLPVGHGVTGLHSRTDRTALRQATQRCRGGRASMLQAGWRRRRARCRRQRRRRRRRRHRPGKELLQQLHPRLRQPSPARAVRSTPRRARTMRGVPRAKCKPLKQRKAAAHRRC
mmetsp:Transcript_5906/g.17631  ORF Transcript_5906/g.17631 Transcript_5906/m.17631 type:complete len:362 (+) Transcript_5906:931-2016(+)